MISLAQSQLSLQNNRNKINVQHISSLICQSLHLWQVILKYTILMEKTWSLYIVIFHTKQSTHFHIVWLPGVDNYIPNTFKNFNFEHRMTWLYMTLQVRFVYCTYEWKLPFNIKDALLNRLQQKIKENRPLSCIQLNTTVNQGESKGTVTIHVFLHTTLWGASSFKPNIGNGQTYMKTKV